MKNQEEPLKTYSLRKNFYKKDAVALAFMSVVAAFLLWKCRYGIANIDESFYLTIPFRLYNGDALFVDEWNLAQMSGLLTAPIVWLYMTITKGLNGIVLFMRYFYVVVQLVIAVFFYFRFKKLTYAGAACAAISFLLYAPYGIMALSYNSMAIMGLVLSFAFLGPDESFSKINYILAGVSFSASVLCCPYLVLVYFLYIVAVIARNIISKHTSYRFESESYIFSAKGAFTFSVGIALSVLVFALFVFSRGSLNDILTSLSHILKDPSHPPTSFISSIKIYILSVFLNDKFSFLVYAGLGILFLVALIDKNRKTHKLTYFAMSGIFTFVLMLLQIRLNYINMLMWSINALAVFVVLLSDKKRTRALFYTFWISGIIYSFCSNWASNQRFYAITSASTVATIGSILMIAAFLKECFEQNTKKTYKQVILALAILLISTQLISQTVLRYKSVFWEKEGMPAQTEYIQSGVQSGLYVSKEKAEEYNKMYARINALEKYNAKSAIFITSDTRYYLYGEYNVGAFSAWLSKYNPLILERLITYYEFNPKMLPDIGYIEMDDSGEDFVAIAERFSDLYGYNWFYDMDGIILVKATPM